MLRPNFKLSIHKHILSTFRPPKYIFAKQQIGFSNLINNNVYIPDTMPDEQYPNLKRNNNSLNK